MFFRTHLNHHRLTCKLLRLALQQYVWQQALGYNIHPRIPQLPETAKIADVAAGTGLWLIEVGRQLPPTVSLNAFDITLRQAPPKPWLPENMDLHNWNIFDEPPSQFQGIFDLVHVRLVTVVIKEHDPTTVMRNLGKLLSKCQVWQMVLNIAKHRIQRPVAGFNGMRSMSLAVSLKGLIQIFLRQLWTHGVTSWLHQNTTRNQWRACK